MERAPRAIERKVVTALFCDVVGSTELGERLDPEDIDRLMGTYHRLARRRIEANGGTVEKFIGDAVVGVFGAPNVHEDDAARAIRSALSMVDELAAANLGLQVRIGIQTGEAVVRVGEDRTAEEGLATGDILNTAARLQNAASPGGIAVGEPTYRATEREFDWEDLGEVPLKGKALPVHVWRPIAGHVEAQPAIEEATPFLGRDEELTALLSAFDRAASGPRIELVTIVAEPGMGKSRLVRELARSVLEHPLVTWRKGRSLAYGDGISFWALGEIVKAQAGILETDDQAMLAAKLNAAIREPDAERHAWLRDRLAPLVGLRTEADAGSQDESFSAWTQFLLALARNGPAVLVFEDLHWADPALVAFLTQLADTGATAPILLVVTARPSVAERHPDWLGRASAGTVVQLVSLGDETVRALLEGALGDAAPALVETVLERAAGSPLYAEQLAALIRERGLEATEGVLDASAIPATIQSLLAARIDALPRELKPALLDASVIGRVFWSGAVGALEAQGSGMVMPVLDDLATRELTRPQEPSSMVGEAEYAFWHALLRDVAYSFLPRASRLAKHRAAATWITKRAGTGLTDIAEIVTDHLRRALELATALDAEDDLPAIRSDLASALIAAADHTFGIVPERAIDQLRDALELLSPGDSRRPGALVAYGRALVARGRNADAAVALEQAVQAYEDAGNELEAAEASIWFSRLLWNAGDGTRARAVVDAIRPTLEAHPGPGLVQLLSDEAVRATSHSDADQAIRHATRALSLAASLGLPRPYRAVAALGAAHDIQGIPRSREALMEVADLAIAAGDTRYAFQLFGNRATQLDDLGEALELFDEALVVAARFGLVDRASRAQRLDTLVLAGRLDEVLEEAPRLLAEAHAHGDAFTAFMARMTLYNAKALRGDVSDPLTDIQDEAVSIGLAHFLPASLVATIALERGEPDRARQVIVDTLARAGERDYLSGVLDLVEITVTIGDLELARAVMRHARPERDPSEGNQIGRQARAMLLEAEGDLAGAAERYEVSAAWFGRFGWAQPQAQGLIGLGRCRLALGDTPGGLEALAQARDIAVRLGSPPLLRQVEAATRPAEA